MVTEPEEELPNGCNILFKKSLIFFKIPTFKMNIKKLEILVDNSSLFYQNNGLLNKQRYNCREWQGFRSFTK